MHFQSVIECNGDFRQSRDFAKVQHLGGDEDGRKRVLAGDVPHLMFPVTFVLFRLVHHVFASWTAYICIPRSSENATPSARVLH